MAEENYMILNGEILNTRNAHVSPLNRGQMYGDGCFDTMRVYGGKLFRADLHYDRLKAGLDHIGIEIRFARDEFKELITDLVKKNSNFEGDLVVRTQCWRKGGRGYATDETDHEWMIQCTPYTENDSELRLDFLQTPCIPSAALSRKYKWTNSLNYIIAAREARNKGYEDGIMLSLEGHISETTRANLFWLEGDCLFTPSEDCDLYPGITRQIVMNIIEASGYELSEGYYPKDEIHNAEAFFCTNSLLGIQGIKAIGYREFDAMHPIIKELRDTYHKMIADESV